MDHSTRVKQLAPLQTATHACGHLLPDGGRGVPPSAAVDRQIQADMRKFARCMRSHGVSNWPDPALDQGRAVFDPGGINTNSPQIMTKVRRCRSRVAYRWRACPPEEAIAGRTPRARRMALRGWLGRSG